MNVISRTLHTSQQRSHPLQAITHNRLVEEYIVSLGLVDLDEQYPHLDFATFDNTHQVSLAGAITVYHSDGPGLIMVVSCLAGGKL